MNAHNMYIKFEWQGGFRKLCASTVRKPRAALGAHVAFPLLPFLFSTCAQRGRCLDPITRGAQFLIGDTQTTYAWNNDEKEMSHI